MELRGHIPSGSAAGPRGARGAGIRREPGEGTGGWRGGTRTRGGGSLAPKLPGGGGGDGTRAGEPETASQFIYKPCASRPPARPPGTRAAASSLLPAPARAQPAAPALAPLQRR